MRIRAATMFLFLLGLLGTAVVAATPAPVQECRANVSGPISVLVIVLIDRTFAAGASQAWLEEALDELGSMDNIAIRIGSFSNASGRNGATLGKLLVRTAAPGQDWLETHRRLEVARLEQCRVKESARWHEQIRVAIAAALSSEVVTAKRTDIAASLTLIAPALQQTLASRRLLILVSDGLEHSQEQDFYADGRPRLIDVSRELKVLSRRNIAADLSGVQIIWTGLGMSRAQMEWASQQALTHYWLEVVKSWGGEPVEFASVPVVRVRQVLLTAPVTARGTRAGAGAAPSGSQLR